MEHKMGGLEGLSLLQCSAPPPGAEADGQGGEVQLTALFSLNGLALL